MKQEDKDAFIEFLMVVVGILLLCVSVIAMVGTYKLVKLISTP